MQKIEVKKVLGSKILGICGLVLFIMFLGDLFAGIPLSIVEFFIKDERILFILEYFSTIGSLLAVLIYIKKKKENNYMLKKLTFKKSGILLGLLIGFILNGLCVLMAYLSGSIVLSFTGASIPLMIIAFVCVVIQSTSEELLCRLFLYQKLKENYKSPLVWIFVSSIFFGLLHIFNPGATLIAITDTILYGLFMACIIYFFDKIWLVSAIHAAWNFSQNFIFGLPNSGIETKMSLFKLISSDNSIYYDTGFGVEGTVFSILLIATAIVIVCSLGVNIKEIKKVK